MENENRENEEILEIEAVDDDITSAVSEEYDASQIQVLEGLEAVRKRPGMYIGSTSASGLHHLVYEIVDNSIDEALAGYCTHIEVAIEPGNIISVRDNGRGIPVDIQEQTGKSALEVVFTVLHAGGKFGGGGYKVSGGLHGVGASVVNALSEWLEVEVYKNGKIHRMEFSRGYITKELTITGDTEETGTYVRFKPDPEMFTDTTTYNYETLHKRMQEEAFLNAGLTITIEDRRPESAHLDESDRKDVLCYEGGIREFVTFLNNNKNPIHEDVIYMSGKKDDAMAELAMQYTDTYSEVIVSFANNVHTPEGGMHEDGFKRALTNAINKYGKKMNILKGDDKVSGEDCREGLTCVISVKLLDAQFEGQTKAKLGNSEVRTLVNALVNEALESYLEENPAAAKAILDKALTANRAREAARKARENVRRSTALESGQMPDKLQDCNERDPSLCEVYIVEGDSAAGSAIQGRDSRFQAILPMWGKMLNVEKARADKIYSNEKLSPLIVALGAGIGDEFNLEKLRYHKIIIMSDADVDGAHIRTLLLTFFFRYMRPLIENGYIYCAVPPLYKLTRGKTTRVAYSDDERDAISAEMRGENQKAEITINRFKGLGEMDAHELWDTTMDPETRTLRRVTLSDAVAADAVFNLLMGEEVDPRREWIEDNAKYVINLDI
ncbi:MAG: DNA topoisomerase (ATP-hydrolyzing) subunit B [Clostridia bacterium]|nr:DNA topoisomerase (ATP-hydrolyzing) subunit B [Clostridia bacterium]